MSPAAAPPQSRLGWVDVMKALGMLLVYIGHMPATGRLFPLIYLFHVPLFFFLAGLFAPRALARPLWQSLRQRTVMLLAPYVVFTLLHAIPFFLARGNEVGWRQVGDWWNLVWQGQRGHLDAPGLWFLPAMWLMAVAYDVLARLARRVAPGSFGWVVVVVAGLLHGVGALVTQDMSGSWFSADWALRYVFFYALGAVLCPWLTRLAAPQPHAVERILSLVGLAIALLAGYLYVATVSSFTRWLGPLNPRAGVVQIGKWTIVQAVLALVLCFGVFLLARTLAEHELLARMGRDSLVFCGMEAFTKITIIQLLSVLGLERTPTSPLGSVVCAVVLFAVVWVAVVPWARAIVNRTTRLLLPERPAA